MTYFELFELPVQLKVDRSLLPQKYFALSREFHPDFYINKTDTEKKKALEISAMLNRALKTLKDEDETIKYVLQLKGLLQEEEKYELPPEFLGEMLELNEQITEAGDEQASATVHTAIGNIESSIYEPVKEIIENYQDGVTAKKELLQVKEYYFKKKYLNRIKQRLTV